MKPSSRSIKVERGVARSHRVVLVGHGRPEERHDPVAHDLIHRPLVPMDGLDHSLEDGVQELPGVFGVPLGLPLTP
jgi:hypothetical protein